MYQNAIGNLVMDQLPIRGIDYEQSLFALRNS